MQVSPPFQHQELFFQFSLQATKLLSWQLGNKYVNPLTDSQSLTTPRPAQIMNLPLYTHTHTLVTAQSILEMLYNTQTQS